MDIPDDKKPEVLAENLLSLEVKASERDQALQYLASLPSTDILKSEFQYPFVVKLREVLEELLYSFEDDTADPVDFVDMLVGFFEVLDLDKDDDDEPDSAIDDIAGNNESARQPSFGEVILLALVFANPDFVITLQLIMYRLNIYREYEIKCRLLANYLVFGLRKVNQDQESVFFDDAFTGLPINLEYIDTWLKIYRDRLLVCGMVSCIDEVSRFRDFAYAFCGSSTNLLKILQVIFEEATQDSYALFSTDLSELVKITSVKECITHELDGKVLTPEHIDILITFFEYLNRYIRYESFLHTTSPDQRDAILKLVKRNMPELVTQLINGPMFVGEFNDIGLFFWSDFFDSNKEEIDRSGNAMALLEQIQFYMTGERLYSYSLDSSARRTQIQDAFNDASQDLDVVGQETITGIILYLDSYISCLAAKSYGEVVVILEQLSSEYLEILLIELQKFTMCFKPLNEIFQLIIDEVLVEDEVSEEDCFGDEEIVSSPLVLLLERLQELSTKEN